MGLQWIAPSSLHIDDDGDDDEKFDDMMVTNMMTIMTNLSFPPDNMEGVVGV